MFQAAAIVVHAVCVSLQGKRVASEDGSDGYSDLYQENAMLQRENDTLRLRVKAMQETIDRLNTRVTHLLANEVSTLLTKSSTSTVLTSCLAPLFTLFTSMHPQWTTCLCDVTLLPTLTFR